VVGVKPLVVFRREFHELKLSLRNLKSVAEASYKAVAPSTADTTDGNVAKPPLRHQCNSAVSDTVEDMS
jgi:hypothetical protein